MPTWIGQVLDFIDKFPAEPGYIKVLRFAPPDPDADKFSSLVGRKGTRSKFTALKRLDSKNYGDFNICIIL